MDVTELLQKTYCRDFDHALDCRNGIEPEDDDLEWLDDFFDVYSRRAEA
jgi:hypothetical protein